MAIRSYAACARSIAVPICAVWSVDGVVIVAQLASIIDAAQSAAVSSLFMVSLSSRRAIGAREHKRLTQRHSWARANSR